MECACYRKQTMSAKATRSGVFKILELIVDAAGPKTTLKHSLPFASGVLSASSSPAITTPTSGKLTIAAGQSVALNLRAIAHPSGATLDLNTLTLKQFGVLLSSGNVSLTADAGLKIGAATLFGGDLLFRSAITDGSAISASNKTITFTAVTDCVIYYLLAA